MRKWVRWGLALLLVMALAALTLEQDSLWRLYYGVNHVDAILLYSRQYDLDPYLVAAVIHTESRFREDAVSKVGAVGLMQLMPETAGEMASEVDLPKPTPQDLQNGDLNIRLGCRYLHFLTVRFPSLELRLAAYNAGPANVHQWLDQSQSKPFPETKAYVENVRATRERLRRLYPEWE